jgi:hypothetical protein
MKFAEGTRLRQKLAGDPEKVGYGGIARCCRLDRGRLDGKGGLQPVKV